MANTPATPCQELMTEIQPALHLKYRLPRMETDLRIWVLQLSWSKMLSESLEVATVRGHNCVLIYSVVRNIIGFKSSPRRNGVEINPARAGACLSLATTADGSLGCASSPGLVAHKPGRASSPAHSQPANNFLLHFCHASTLRHFMLPKLSS